MKEQNQMLECFELAETKKQPGEEAAVTLSLTFAQRQKSRAKAASESGREVAWFLPRGHVLADGDCLKAQDGSLVCIIAAAETVSEVSCDNPLLLSRAAYHLGNRHVPLQIDAGRLRYQHDHVLDAMLTGLGLRVDCVQQPFHPEPGAYHSHAVHAHGPGEHSSDQHSSDDNHSHSHGH